MGMRAAQLRNPWNQRNEDNIVQMAREEYSRNFMQKRLESMTACVDTSGPKGTNMKHLELRLKKVQLQEDRRQTIARDNRKLMEKMTDIIEGKGKKPLFTPAFQLRGSLNERERREYVDKVNTNNKLLLQRLKTQSAYINVPKMEEDFQRWLENRKVCSKAYKRQKRAKMIAKRRRAAAGGGQQHQDSPYQGSPPQQQRLLETATTPGTAQGDLLSSSASPYSSGSRTAPFRTAKQLREGMLAKDGGGGFVPLPSLVAAPPPSTQPTFTYSSHDASVNKVGDLPVQFGIQHQGSSSSSTAHGGEVEEEEEAHHHHQAAASASAAAAAAGEEHAEAALVLIKAPPCA